MNQDLDFERMWLSKFSNCLDEEVGQEAREYILAGSEELTRESDRDDVILWTKGAMARLEDSIQESKRRAVMTGCACLYPSGGLKELRELYRKTGDLDQVHGMMQEKFLGFLRDDLELDEDLIGEAVSRGWGLAGKKNGKNIIATKIPKSGNLRRYFQESDPVERRKLYCHCPRVRDAAGEAELIPLTYCYCGAGYYKDIWERIIEQPVQVEVLESVLSGGDECKIAVYLP